MNRIVIEVDRTGYKDTELTATIRAEYPDDVTVIFVDKFVETVMGGYDRRVYGDGGLPIEPLAVVGEEVRFEVVE